MRRLSDDPMRRLLPLLAALLALPACDADDPADAPVVFQGVEVEAVGDARLEVVGGTLVVSGLEGAREGGFVARDAPGGLEVEVAPLDVPAGGRFGSEVRSADGALVAALYNEGLGDGRVDFQFDFGDAPPPFVEVRYLLDGVVQASGVLRVLPRTSGARAPQSAGEGDGDTGSTHVVRENGRYVVVSDSDAGDARRAGGCDGYLVTPPLGLNLPLTVCADWVEVRPPADAPAPTGEVAVRARGVGQFVVRQLSTP